MAKVHMSTVAGWPVRTLRRMAGIRAHRPSGFNACIGAALKDRTFPAPPGEGGQLNKALQAAFSAAVDSCKSGRRAVSRARRRRVAVEE